MPEPKDLLAVVRAEQAKVTKAEERVALLRQGRDAAVCAAAAAGIGSRPIAAAAGLSHVMVRKITLAHEDA